MRYTMSMPEREQHALAELGDGEQVLDAVDSHVDFFDFLLSTFECFPLSSVSAAPPAAAIFFAASPLNLCARTVSPFEISPRPSTFTRLADGGTRRRSRSRSSVTTVPASKRSPSVSRLTTAYSMRNGLWNPRFGTRRLSGIWPPSNPTLRLKPERDFAPLWPRPACVPWPEPWPRPTRFFECFAPFGGFKFEKSIFF